MRLSKLSQRELERRLGWTNGTLSRIFNGKTALQYGHILAILQVLDLSPGRFFEIVYKPNTTRRDVLAELFEEIEGAPVAVQKLGVPELSVQEIEGMVAGFVEEASGRPVSQFESDPFSGIERAVRRRATKPRIRLRPERS
jgi:transcriptional regulator with XRE-family HTH domain